MEICEKKHTGSHSARLSHRGILVDYPKVSEDSATAAVSTHVRNEISIKAASGKKAVITLNVK